MFERVQENPSYGQYLLDFTDLKRYEKFIFSKKFYSEQSIGNFNCEKWIEIDGNVIPVGGTMVSVATEYMVEKFGLGPGLKSRLVVFPESFSCDYILNYDDFFGILTFHEGFHAEETYLSGIVKKSSLVECFAHENSEENLKRNLTYIRGELGALENEKLHFSKNNSESYKNRVFVDIEKYLEEEQSLVEMLGAES